MDAVGSAEDAEPCCTCASAGTYDDFHAAAVDKTYATEVQEDRRDVSGLDARQLIFELLRGVEIKLSSGRHNVRVSMSQRSDL